LLRHRSRSTFRKRLDPPGWSLHSRRPQLNFDERKSLAMTTAAPATPAAGLARGVARLFGDHGIAALTELPLANGRRVDVIGLDRNGGVHVAEIKSCRADFLTDHKWTEYLDYCDHFYFAVAADFPRDLLPDSEGQIIADRYGGEIVREARHRPLPAARRKALTLRFARAAAGRLIMPMLEAPASIDAQLA
jgi:hypothetical protein